MEWLIEREGLSDFIRVESAGTAAYHVGELPDGRTRQAAQRRGVLLQSRARQFVSADFERFDYILAMDHQNRDNILALAPDERAKGKVMLFRAFDPDATPEAEVPDPYYGGPEGFDHVFEICMRGCQGLLDHIRSAHPLA